MLVLLEIADKFTFCYDLLLISLAHINKKTSILL